MNGQFRIVEVYDDLFGHYFAAQRRGGLFNRWKDITWSVPDKIDNEWRCHSLEQAKKVLEDYKKRNTISIIYQE